MAKDYQSQNRIPFEYLDRPSTFILSNLAWIVLAIPVITLPLGTLGLFNVMSLWARGKQPEFFEDFFIIIRRRWWKALLMGLFDFVVGALIVANLAILNKLDFWNPLSLIAYSATAFITFVFLMSNMYIWSLLVVAEFGLQRIVILSFKLAVAHPIASFVTLITGVSPLAASVFFGFPAFLWFLGLVALSCLIINWGTWRVIRRYVPEAELHEYEGRDKVLLASHRSQINEPTK